MGNMMGDIEPWKNQLADEPVADHSSLVGTHIVPDHKWAVLVD